jgi:TonB family protein
VDAGIAANERALAIRPDFPEALAFRSVLLRMKAGMVAEESARQALLAEAETARLRALELRKGTTQGEMAFSPRPGQPPPPPPPPPPAELLGQAPIRVGGSVKPPTKTRDVKPEYPPVARDAGVQGVVISEVTIGPAGDVVQAHILRGQPLLDQAALDAVRQWQFAPTLLNGVAVPVIMTVTVNFTLQ